VVLAVAKEHPHTRHVEQPVPSLSALFQLLSATY
jgi:hypothetical protein